MFLHNILIVLFAISAKLICAHEAKDLDDSILYKIEFELPVDLESEDFNTRYKISTFHTHDHEEYKCAIPISEESREEKNLDYTGLSPLELIDPMFSSISCSYRIEAYWSYEICHGFHIKQYHEEREGKNVKIQEYYLGRWSDEKQEKLAKQLVQDRKDGVPFKTTKIDNVNYPYLELEMNNGTLCDLNNEPRTTRIRYVCYPHGKNAVYSFKETSSCNYEAIILTSSLCIHPAFLPEESKEIPVKCFNSPTLAREPLSLLKQNLEDLQMYDLSKIDIYGNNRQFSVNNLNILDLQKVLEGVAAKTLAGQDETAVTPSSVPIDENPGLPIRNPEYSSEDYEALFEFLFGNCLIGGTGWWKYEFCFGRHVRQFHKDKKSETEVMLGYFKEDLHREWLKSHPTKRLRHNPNDPDTTLWNHYTGGSRCDKTGNLRETDVKLMCISSSSTSSPSAVSMYLLEPKTCQYILVVESPMVCPLIPMVDEDGLISKIRFAKFLYSLVKKTKEDLKESQGSEEEKKTEEGTSEGTISIVTEDETPEEVPVGVMGF